VERGSATRTRHSCSTRRRRTDDFSHGLRRKCSGLSARSVRRLLVRYKASAQTSSLLPHQGGPHKRLRRLGADRERLIDLAIDQFYLIRPRKPMEEVYREVARQCREKHWVAPVRDTVISRIRALDARLVARRRLGAKSAEPVALSTPGSLEATEALELVQMDHTLADVMIVDSSTAAPSAGPGYRLRSMWRLERYLAFTLDWKHLRRWQSRCASSTPRCQNYLYSPPPRLKRRG